MDLDRDLILQTFAAQSEEGLATMEQALIDLEHHPEDDEILHLIFRVCHTLKGDSASLGFATLADFAHGLEDFLDGLRERRIAVDGEVVTLLLEAVDALHELLRCALEGGEAEPAEHAELLGRLRERAAESNASREATVGAPEKSPPPQQPSGVPGAARADARRRSFRVSFETVDRLVSLAGELAVSRGRIAQMLAGDRVHSPSEILELHRATDHIFSELQREVMKVRMVPVGTVFLQHLRTVRDLSLAHGKRARLEIEGEEAELDTTVIEQLRDPLSHMVRNAIAHGIEPPEEREARGKDPCGCVRLRAAHEGPSIIVEVSDDGAGLDLDRIRERAFAQGLAAEPGKISDSEAAQLVFEPGLSTSADATLTSGRGVGMDVVRRNIEAMHGSVSLTSAAGKGTTVSIRLPLTLAIIDGFAVGVGSEIYVIPLAAVVECLDLPRETARRVGSAGLINLRGSSLPYVRLRDVLGASGEPADREKVVVIRHNGEDAGVAVDALYGEHQLVIKPLDKIFRNLPGIGGATIFDDGRVALILDVPALLRKAVGWQTGGEAYRAGSGGALESSGAIGSPPPPHGA